MYTVYNKDNISKYRKIYLCKDHNRRIRISFYVILFVLYVIFSNGLFPKPIMFLLEKVGLIEYTVIHDAHIVRGHKGIRSITGWYTDKNSKIHNADIVINYPFLLHHNLNLSESVPCCNSDVTLDGAYYTFMPFYEMMRHPSNLSVLFVYLILVSSIWWFFSNIHKKRSLLINAELNSMTLIRPIGIYSEEIIKKNKSEGFETTIIWETPYGICYGDPERKKNKIMPSSQSFQNEYCACYIRTKNNEEMIIMEENYFELEKYNHLKHKLSALKTNKGIFN